MIQPVKNNVLLKMFLEDEVSEGGIIVPESFRKETDKGEVIAVGNGTSKTPMQFIPGDNVFRVHSWGTKIQENGETFYLMTQDSILAKV